MTMEPYTKTFEVRWGEIDPNGHVRHTIYGDYATQVRVGFLTDHGLSMKKWMEMGIGPAVLSEEIQYLKEVALGEKVTIDFQLAGIAASHKRFRLRHQIFKEDGSVAVQITMIIGWIDLQKRKLIVVDERHPLFLLFDKLPRTSDFTDAC